MQSGESKEENYGLRNFWLDITIAYLIKRNSPDEPEDIETTEQSVEMANEIEEQSIKTIKDKKHESAEIADDDKKNL